MSDTRNVRAGMFCPRHEDKRNTTVSLKLYLKPSERYVKLACGQNEVF